MNEPIGVLPQTDIDNFKPWYSLTFTKSGRLIHKKWIYDEDRGEGAYFLFDVTNEPYIYLNDSIEVEDGFTLNQLYECVANQADILNIVYQNCWILDFVNFWPKEETPPIKHDYDPDGIEFIELYWSCEMDAGYLNECNRANCHGLGWELKEDKFEKYDDEIPSWKKGSRIPWGIDFMELKELAHIPLKLNENWVIYEDLNDRKLREAHSTELFVAKKKYTLGDIIDGVFWELSFYGSPENKAEKKKEIHAVMSELDLEHSTVDSLVQKGKLIEFNCSSFKEELNDGFINDGMGWRSND